MKVCVVRDEDSIALLNKLELEKHKLIEHHKDHWPMIDDVHRHFHYYIVRWLQEQGLETVKF